ncbi:MAG: type II secretion system F family protein [Methanomassiliicoccales archaeon]|nr:type II secretion system F family protein [Methanomassiliicoccales archaeon]
MAENELLEIEQLTLKKRDYSRTLLILGTVAFAFFAFLGVIDAVGGLETGLEWIDWVAIGLMALCGPYGFYTTYRYKRIREIESRLPDFLRDVAEGGRFGMTLAESIKVSSRGRYGRLTPEIQRMASQIDWGVPATDAIKLFIDRVDTPLVRRMTSIVIKANDAGGNVADVLDMVAHDARETMLNRNERSIAMSTYTVVIYVAFAVFLATIFILNSTFLPRMVEAGTTISEDAPDIGGVPVQVKADVVPQVQLIFVISVVIHAFGDGILAGVLEDGRIANGFRHSFIMLLLGLIGTRLLG